MENMKIKIYGENYTMHGIIIWIEVEENWFIQISSSETILWKKVRGVCSYRHSVTCRSPCSYKATNAMIQRQASVLPSATKTWLDLQAKLWGDIHSTWTSLDIWLRSISGVRYRSSEDLILRRSKQEDKFKIILSHRLSWGSIWSSIKSTKQDVVMHTFNSSASRGRSKDEL